MVTRGCVTLSTNDPEQGLNHVLFNSPAPPHAPRAGPDRGLLQKHAFSGHVADEEGLRQDPEKLMQF